MTTTDSGADTATQLAETILARITPAVRKYLADADVWDVNPHRLAAALLPVVDRIARTHAAHELDTAALTLDTAENPPLSVGLLRDRAAALRTEP